MRFGQEELADFGKKIGMGMVAGAIMRAVEKTFPFQGCGVALDMGGDLQ
jgi:hypothetical protein